MADGTDSGEKPNVESILEPALRALLTKILEKPFSPRSLIELEKTARLVRELLVVGMDPMALQSQYGTSRPLVMQNMDGGLYDTPFVPISGIGYGSSLSSLSTNLNGLLPNSPVGSSKSENFGAQIIRELFGVLGAKNQNQGQDDATPAELVASIALAREKGLTDVAEKLEAKLLGPAPAIEAKPWQPEVDVKS